MDDKLALQIMKLAFASTVGILVNVMGGKDNLLLLFGALLGFDFVTGVLKAIRTKTLKSGMMRWGAVNKVLEAVVIMIFNLFDMTMGLNIFRSGAIAWFCICEAASVLENLAVLGVPCPDGFRETVMKLKVGVSVNFVEIFTRLLNEKSLLMKEDKDNADH